MGRAQRDKAPHTAGWPVQVLYRTIDCATTDASVVWGPYNKCDINKIEAVQRYFTKRLGGLGHMSYCQRLSILELDSLHLRRIKADLLLCYND